MVELTVNYDECNGCGHCVAVCPHGNFKFEDKVLLVTSKDCMFCGHCQAACPVNCIVVDGIDADLHLKNVNEKSGVSLPGCDDPADLIRLMRSRRSCRNYRKDPVSLELLGDLVKIGVTAPSGTNSQGWEFILVPSRADVVRLGDETAKFYQKLNKIAQSRFLRFFDRWFGSASLSKYYNKYYSSVRDALTKWDQHGDDLLFHGAVAAILVTGRKEASCPAEDAMLAIQNILLAAHSLGLGSCLIGFVVEAVKRDKGLRAVCGIRGDEDLYGVVALGYPAERYMRPAGRKKVVPRILQFE